MVQGKTFKEKSGGMLQSKSKEGGYKGENGGRGGGSKKSDRGGG